MTGGYHRIAGVTPATTSLLHGGTNSFVGTWTGTSDLTCRDCHNKNTSTNIYYGKLLKGVYTSNTGKSGVSTTNHLCFICHSTTAYGPSSTSSSGSGFKKDSSNLHAKSDHKAGCMACHTSKTHSTSLKHLIATGETYSQIRTFTHTTSYSKSSCGTTSACH